jgi:hypothetical protein
MIRSNFIRFLLLNLIIFHELPILSSENLFYRPPDAPKISSTIRKFFEANSNSETQIKAWVLFTDKNISNNNQFYLQKKHFAAILSKKSIKRRLKVLSDDKLIDHADLPVPSFYIKKILETGATHRTTSRWFNAISVIATKSQIEQIEKLNFVRRITKVYGFNRNEKTQESFSQDQSHHNINPAAGFDYGPGDEQMTQINVPPLHRQGYSGYNVLVCILDTGFRKDHEVFAEANIIAERDFIFDDDDTQSDPLDLKDPSNKHGTTTWSVLGGFKNGELIGSAYGADFLLAKTEDLRSETPVEEDFWIEAAEWADSLGAQVISSSSGYSEWHTFGNLDGNTISVTNAADRAVRLGMVVVTACGNDRQTSWGHIVAPADADSVISVGAVQADGLLAGFSSPGPTYDGRIKPEVCARGLYVACALSKHKTAYGYMSGTSLSTPLVAGVAALLLEIHPEWTPMNVRDALMMTASQSFSPDNDYGWGIINASAASQVTFSDFVLDMLMIDDDSNGESRGNGNALIEPGECIELFPILINKSSQFYSKMNATIETTDKNIQIINNFIHLGDYGPGERKTGDESFLVAIRDSIPPNAEVSLSLFIRADKELITKFNPSLKIFQSVSGVVPRTENTFPSDFHLYPIFPNPFNLQTVIRYRLVTESEISVKIYNISGQYIRKLVSDKQAAGNYQIVWDARDDAGLFVTTGTYLCRLQTPCYQSIQKVIFLK